MIGCVFKDGKGIKGTLLSEDAYYLYVKTEKENYYTIMKGASSYIIHVKHDLLLRTNDFYTEEMKLANYKKSTEYVFSVGDTITVYFFLAVRVYQALCWMTANIGAVKNIHFYVEVTDEEVMLFGGGA